MSDPALPAAVLWDLDGTLVDTEPLWFAAEEALAARHEAPWSAQDARAIVGNALLDSGAYIKDRMGLSLTPTEVVEELLDFMVPAVQSDLVFRPGAVELLAELGGSAVPCALVTASWRRMVDPIVALLPQGTFAAVVTGDEVSRGKPHPDAYLLAARALGVDAANCLVIEDSATGAAAAEAAGAAVVVVPNQVEVPHGPRRVQLSSLAGLQVADLLQVAATIR